MKPDAEQSRRFARDLQASLDRRLAQKTILRVGPARAAACLREDARHAREVAAEQRAAGRKTAEKYMTLHAERADRAADIVAETHGEQT